MTPPAWVKRGLALVLVGAAAWFIGRTVASNWQQLRGFAWRGNALLLLLSLIAHVGVLAWGVYVWSRVLRRFRTAEAGFPQLLRIWALSNGAKYIPGNIWQFVAAAQLSGDAGLAKAAALSSMLIHVGLSLVAAALVAVATIPLDTFALSPAAGSATRFISVVGAIAVVHPRVFNLGLRLIPRAIHREVLRWHGSWAEGIGLLLLSVASWILYGIAYFLFLRALTPVPVSAFGLTSGVNALAFLAGYLVIPAPGGLGIREGAMTLLLDPVLPIGVAAVVAIGARLWSIAAELALAGLALVLGRRDRARAP